MLPITALNPESDTPLYRQLHAQLRQLIDCGRVQKGSRLPATRELAGQLGLNRATVSAAYELLETDGLITGHVGRGSFVADPSAPANGAFPALDWREILPVPPLPAPAPAPAGIRISFSSSRPSELLFPLDAFRASCAEVIAGGDAQTILQLGSPAGYAPLRRYVLEQAKAEGVARPSDDVLITSGCQQAFDLLQRTLIANGETVLVEDPVYAGLKNVFERAGARVIGAPVGPDGVDMEALERAIRAERPRLLIVTSNFQNPTGATLPLASRKEILDLARQWGVIVVENDIYGALAYEGDIPPPIKRLDHFGDTILLRSFSKLAFPGLRVGWVVGPRAIVERLTEAKQLSDLHTDQLSQAVLLRFAESGRLDAHRERILTEGRLRLRAVLAACGSRLPRGTEFTRPRGGMNLWVRLPYPLNAAELLPRAEREGVSYLPGKYFAVSRPAAEALRLSFAGLTPEDIETGVAILGRIFEQELERVRARPGLEVPAMV